MNKTKIITIFLAVLIVSVLSIQGAWASDAAQTARAKINLNTATAAELTKLDGVGPKSAQKIVAYRAKNGPFMQPEDIMKVEGIGHATYELNKSRIEVDRKVPAKTDAPS